MKSANLVQIGKIVIDEHCPEPKLTSPEQTLVRVRYAAINADDYSAFAGYLGRVYNSQRLLHESPYPPKRPDPYVPNHPTPQVSGPLLQGQPPLQGPLPFHLPDVYLR